MGRLLRTAQANRGKKDHAKDQIILPKGAVIETLRVDYISGYKLKLYFSNGAERVVDFEPFLRKSRNPMIRAYLDPEKFANFALEHGDLMWDDYGLCFPIANLYENNI
jgi:Protein of unknown function (DUF2442).